MATIGATLSTDTVMYAGTLGAQAASSAYLEGGAALGDVLSSAVYPASHYLDPDGDITNQWTKSTGTVSFSLIDDAVRQPSAATTGTDRLTTTTSGQVTEVSLETATKRTTISSVIAWWHGANGHATKSSVALALFTGVTSLTSTTVTATTETWYSVTYTGDLTQGQLDDLRIRWTYNESSTTTTTGIINAGYAEVVY